ncbi:ABC transporter substrate-binding protein [Celeribacter indicus]|nr:ABC transporter substrate-binding protein [Celeribacter indicus]
MKFILLSLVAGTLASPVLAQDEMTFQANWLIQGENAYMVAGKEKGFFDDEGIDLTIQRGFGSGDTIKKVVTGTATVGTADSGTVMVAIEREGLPLKCIASEYTSSPQGIWVLKSSGITSLGDLEGKTFGLTAGNSMQVYFPVMAEAVGLDPDSVRFVNMEASALLPTLLAGQIDAMTGFATVIDLRNEEAQAQGEELQGMTMAENGLRIYGECQFTRTDVIEQTPDLLERYLRAMRRSLEWSRDNPEETARIISAQYPELGYERVLKNHLAYLDFVFNDLSEDIGVSHIDRNMLQQTFDIVANSQGLDTEVDVEKFYDDSMVPE